MIHTFIIAAITADGFIAKNDHHLASWTSKEDKKFFVERTKQAGVVIMGSKTFETFGQPLKGRFNVVYSHDKKYEGVETTTKTPADLLQELENRGYTEAAICGGAGIYTMFMRTITIEPLIFGGGIGIFNGPIDVSLNLKTFKHLSDDVLLLEYGIIKR